ncbi:MAG: rhodanese-like domain-containing protein [Gallionellaceae bacterium]
MQFLLNNLLMVVIFITSGFMLFWSFFGNRIRGIQEVDTIGALNLINHKDALVLDVREQKEFDEGHLLRAKLIPLGSLKERIGELEKYRDKPILLMCRSGARSLNATVMLSKQGFSDVSNLAGGINAWRKANLPVER